MTQVSAIVPTHDRPRLLPEAIASLLRQSCPPGEIVVVDDGSEPPVNAAALPSQAGTLIVVLRNHKARGLPWARHQGVQASRGEIVVHLDDDDLLAPDTIADGMKLFNQDPEIEVVFMGTRAFGRNAAHFNQVQTKGADRVIAHNEAIELEPNVFELQDNLIVALLRAVPQAFQHTMVRRNSWDQVTRLRKRAYCIEDPDLDKERAMARINGPLRDSEWALYAAALCRKTVLLQKPCYLFRSDGQSYVSHPENREKHIQQLIEIKRQFLDAARKLPELKQWEDAALDSLATDEFDAAFHYCNSGDRKQAWHHLQQACRLRPRLVHGMFAIKLLLLPRDAPA